MNDNEMGGEAPVRLAIVTAQTHPRIAGGLQNGAANYLKKQGLEVDPADIFEAPGEFEVPLIAQKLGESGRYDGVICVGAVIKGDTANFENVSEAVSQGLMLASLETGIPMTFGILTTYDSRQARARSRGNSKNKGMEAAAACVDAIQTLRTISNQGN